MIKIISGNQRQIWTTQQGFMQYLRQKWLQLLHYDNN
jgi:hypothetical protein